MAWLNNLRVLRTVYNGAIMHKKGAPKHAFYFPTHAAPCHALDH